MTATERIRAMLDERGVPWKDYGHENHTWWGEWHAENRASVNGLFLKVEGVVTPEQAIEATLGRGTCRMEKRHMDWRCTGCGEIVGTDDPTSELFIDGNAVELWRYCPNCGRKVVDA